MARSVRRGGIPLVGWIRNFWYQSVRNQSLEFYQLLVTTAVLTAFGLLMVLSASVVNSLSENLLWYGDILSQVIAFALGFALLLVFSLTPTSLMDRFIMPTGWFVIGLQYLTAMVGLDINGNKAWLKIGPITFQPSELGKVLLVMMLAKVIAQRIEFPVFRGSNLLLQRPELSAMSFAIVMFIGVTIQKDVGTVLVMAVMTLVLLWVAGIDRYALLGWLAVFGVAGMAAMTLSDTRWPRIMAWLNPASDVLGIYTYQSQHGFWALAAGGLLGVGLGQSTLKWTWIPEVQNDFIYAVVVEEFGFVGGAAVLVAFLFLGYVLIRIFHRTQDIMRRLIIAGVFAWIVVQALINIGVVIGALPVLGVPLPFISHGGTSMLFLLSAVGVVLAIERENTHGQLAPRKKVPQATRRPAGRVSQFESRSRR